MHAWIGKHLQGTALRTLAALAVLPLLLFVLSAFAAEGAAERQLLSLPEGDAEAGRLVFRELKCFSCHRILGDIEMALPVAGQEGPALGLRQARYKERFIADSVVFPSHAIAPGSKGRSGPEGFSRMGDFSDSMTVRQLADLVAYLKQLDEEV